MGWIWRKKAEATKPGFRSVKVDAGQGEQGPRASKRRGELALQVSVSEVSGSFDAENVLQDAGRAQASTKAFDYIETLSVGTTSWPIASSAPLPIRLCSLL